MITLIICVRRAAHVTHGYFETYWRDHHGPLVTSVTEFTRHLRAYRQFHLIDCHELSNTTGDPWHGFDGIALLSFESAQAMQAAFQEPRFLSVLEPDTLNFGDLANSPRFLVSADDTEDPPRSRHGNITVFEFAGPGTRPILQVWTKNGSREPQPATVARYQSIAADNVDGSNPAPPATYITACSFTSLAQAEGVLTYLAERDSAAFSSVGSGLIHVMAREHIFI